MYFSYLHELKCEACITEMNYAEHTSHDEHSLRLLIDNIDEPVWLVDNDLIIVACNNAFRKWVSNFIGVEIGKGDDVLYGGTDKAYKDKYEMCYRLALSGREFRSVEDMTVEGELHYTSVAFKPVAGEGGSVVGVSCVARDITEHRKHLFQIENQNAALREIAFIESHKIRGPVATILGLEQFYNYEDLSDPINIEIMEGVKQMSVELDVMIREVVRMSNALGM